MFDTLKRHVCRILALHIHILTFNFQAFIVSTPVPSFFCFKFSFRYSISCTLDFSYLVYFRIRSKMYHHCFRVSPPHLMDTAYIMYIRLWQYVKK